MQLLNGLSQMGHDSAFRAGWSLQDVQQFFDLVEKSQLELAISFGYELEFYGIQFGCLHDFIRHENPPLQTDMNLIPGLVLKSLRLFAREMNEQ
jgi:hypothetical protein